MNNDPAPIPFDTITVPDFRPPVRGRFTARTLFFLAAWDAYGGAARSFPLHLACITAPPSPVTALAERVGAHIHVFPPLQIDQRSMSNKLRGLEIETATERLLLVDTDVLVLADPAPLARLHPEPFLGLAPAGWAPNIPDPLWHRIYDALDLPPPEAKMAPAILRTPLRFIAQQTTPRLNMMRAYYNGGVLFAPAAVPLRQLWQRHLETIASLWPATTDRDRAPFNDQLALATVSQQMRREGIPFVELPPSFNTRWFELFGRALSLSETTLLHAISIFSEEPALNELQMGLRRYQDTLRHRFDQALLAQPHLHKLTSYFRHMRPARRDAELLNRRLKHLYREYIKPLLS